MEKDLKNNIEKEIENQKLGAALEHIIQYKKRHPMDRDLSFYECIVNLLLGQIEEAKNIAETCVQKFPTSYEAYYYQACVYQADNMLLDALKSYKISRFLHMYTSNDENDITKDIDSQCKILEKEVEREVNKSLDENDIKNIMRATAFFARQDTIWGKMVKAPRSSKELIVGKEYWVSDDDLRYVGVYTAPVQDFIGDENYNLIRTQAEFLKFYKRGTDITISGDAEEYLVPVASEENGNVHMFSNVEDEKCYVLQKTARHFNYYRIKNNTTILSKQRTYYGYPIPLEHKKDRKKLVLSFFVDGLAQEVIKGDDFQKLMPNTYHFFKEGTICTNVYSGSEWTFPSLATYESGLSTLSHMMFHNTIDGELPHKISTLSEYIKNKGYYTCKLDGEWRSVYSYGFARGLDSYIYQIQSMGARAEQEIINVIEHIEAFKDTDQYLWMTIGDLHDIADGLDLSLAVQNNCTIDERAYEEKGKTSVKQNYSKNKTEVYKKTITYLDMLFGLLFTYIQNNFNDDEILISLFSDHGQGYLVPQEAHFLSKERTNVAFMFRGSNIKKQVVDEIISTADYLPIMCKMLGIDVENTKIDGQLPKTFGGENERLYAITESLHPHDKYSAVANIKEGFIYFDNTEETDEEGRFVLENYKVAGHFKDGSPIEDHAILDKFEKIFLDRIAEHIIYQ